jgi:hypothetical protein
LTYAKAKRLSNIKRRSALRKQLEYVRVSISTIDKYLENQFDTFSEAIEELYLICLQIYLNMLLVCSDPLRRVSSQPIRDVSAGHEIKI